MLGTFRRYANTWPARILFLMLAGAFGLWGVADMIRNVGHTTAVATVAGQKIQAQTLQNAYQEQLAQVTRSMGNNSEPSPELRRAVAGQALQRLIMQAVLADAVQRMGLTVPNAALRQAVFDMPAFHGQNGQFDRATFERVLANNNLTEDRFLAMMRDELGNRQLLESIVAGIGAPEVLTRQIFAYQNERRVADLATVPFSAAPPPPAPTDAELHRWYDNHPESYSAPEYRRIRVAVLSPEILAKSVKVPEDQLRAAYAQNKARYQASEKRSVEVLLSSDQAKAQALATAWQKGADWAAMQQTAKTDGASAVALADAGRAEIPSSELAKAVFDAKANSIVGPIKTALGWYVLRVTKISPAREKSFDSVKQALHDQLAQQQAADLVDARANKVEDALSGGAKLDELPGNLGLAGVSGTLDAKGMTPEGQPAPIPGSPELRQAVVKAAFTDKVGETPELTQGPNNSYYALAVEKVIPAARKPFDKVKDQVAADWKQHAIQREQNVAATALMMAVKSGHTFAAAAKAAGLAVTQSAPILRDGPPPQGVPPQLVAPLFGMQPGHPTMVQTQNGFVVAVLTKIVPADPKADPAGYAQLRDALTKTLGNDAQDIYATALRNRANPRVNQKLLDQVAQP